MTKSTGLVGVEVEVGGAWGVGPFSFHPVCCCISEVTELRASRDVLSASHLAVEMLGFHTHFMRLRLQTVLHACRASELPSTGSSAPGPAET